MLPPLGTQDLIALVEERSPSDEPIVLFGVAIALHHNLHRANDEMLDEFVGRARAAGIAWERIGDLLGVTRQAAHARFAERVPSASSYRWARRFPSQWSTDARRVLVAATEAARSAGAPDVGVVHLLMGLTATPSPAAEVLAEASVTLDRLRARLPEGSTDEPRSLPWSDALQEVFDAADESCGHEHPVEPRHLLLGALDAEGSPAPDLLRAVGANPDVVRPAARRLVQGR